MNRREFLQVVTGLAASVVITKIPEQKQKQKPEENTEELNLFVALFNGFREISGNGYHRVKIKTENSFCFNYEGNLVNNDNIVFPKAHLDWGEITHFELRGESAKGCELFSMRGTIANSPTITDGDIVQFPVGNLQIDL